MKRFLFAEIKSFKYVGGFGDKLIGFLYSECYEHTIYALVFGNSGIALVVGNK
ncbi:MAG: hypothetical protein Q7J67_00240 [bacterium]|nr:hypothetical protein [bacterium]